MCQTQRSLSNADSFVMHPGLISGWMALVMIVDSALRYENLIARRSLHHVAAQLCAAPQCIINYVTSDLLSVFLEMDLLPVKCLLWFVLTGTNELSGLFETQFVRNFRLKCKVEVWLARMLHLVPDSNYFVFIWIIKHAIVRNIPGRAAKSGACGPKLVFASITVATVTNVSSEKYQNSCKTHIWHDMSFFCMLYVECLIVSLHLHFAQEVR